MLTFLQRALLALAGVVSLAMVLVWTFGESWWGAAFVAASATAAVWMAGIWLQRHVAAQHEHFRAVLRDLRESLPTGRTSIELKSDRPGDSFGALAREINDLVQQASDQISAQLERHRDLEQTKTLFQSILGTMVEGVLVLDAHSCILYFNPAARRLLACTTREVAGRPLWEVVRETELQAAVDAVRRGEEDFRREAEFQRSRSVVEITAARLWLQGSAGVVVVLHDVTELRKLERMRREFVSNVSHELKTPLTSIQAYADTLLEGGLDDEVNRRRFVTRIVEQSARLQTLIQDMLRLARIESQSEAFELQPVDVAAVLRACAAAHEELAGQRKIALRLEAEEPGLIVRADPEGLRTIVDNLVSNALNHTPENGSVAMRGRVRGHEAAIEVQDDGIGIAAEHRERIFERFYRVDRARSRGVGGTGLGLAIVKHLAQLFGGEVEVESAPGRGSLFRVRLPLLSQPAEPAPSEAADSPAAPLPGDVF